MTEEQPQMKRVNSASRSARKKSSPGFSKVTFSIGLVGGDWMTRKSVRRNVVANHVNTSFKLLVTDQPRYGLHVEVPPWTPKACPTFAFDDLPDET